ncbi:MAG: metalloregulator ArsR/SmtB family transcription factor [Candidatus Margulisiibacteriota bacterium]
MKLLKEKYIKYLEILGNEERMKMLELLARKEMSVQEINSHFFASQPTISYHLALLKSIGFISSRKSGKFMYYSFETENTKKYLKKFVRDFAFSMDRIRTKELKF